MASLAHSDQTRPFRSPQDQIQWGILFLRRQLRNFRPQDREQCLDELWEWARHRADLLALHMIRDYRQCCKRDGAAYLRHRSWFWSNRDNPQFWTEWERRFGRSQTEGAAESIRVKLELR